MSNPLDILIPQTGGPVNRWRWGVVTAVTPAVTVRLEGDTTDLTPTSTLVNTAVLAVNDRVWCQVFGRRLVVLGRGRGLPAASTGAPGIVELATEAETIAGTDTARAVTPAGLSAVKPSTPQIGEWGGKEGPSSWSAAYVNVWASSVNSLATPVSINAAYSTTQIQILQTGQYEVEARQRGGGASTGYIAIGLNGDRTTLENRAGGIWTHDHTGGTGNFSTSKYMGLLNAGELITAGGAGSTDLAFSTSGFSGTFTVKRIG